MFKIPIVIWRIITSEVNLVQAVTASPSCLGQRELYGAQHIQWGYALKRGGNLPTCRVPLGAWSSELGQESQCRISAPCTSRALPPLHPGFKGTRKTPSSHFSKSPATQLSPASGTYAGFASSGSESLPLGRIHEQLLLKKNLWRTFTFQPL